MPCTYQSSCYTESHFLQAIYCVTFFLILEIKTIQSIIPITLLIIYKMPLPQRQIVILQFYINPTIILFFTQNAKLYPGEPHNSDSRCHGRFRDCNISNLSAIFKFLIQLCKMFDGFNFPNLSHFFKSSGTLNRS